MGLILISLAPRESGIECGTWELFDGLEEPQVWHGSRFNEMESSSPWPTFELCETHDFADALS